MKRKLDGLEWSLLILEEWAVERFENDGRFATQRKDAAWEVCSELRRRLKREAIRVVRETAPEIQTSGATGNNDTDGDGA